MSKAKSASKHASREKAPKTAQDCLDKYLPIALEIPLDDRPVFRGNPALARANIRYALESHGLTDSWLASTFQNISIASFEDLSHIARALHLAATTIPSPVASDNKIREMMIELSPLREEGLAELRALSRRKIVTAEKIKSVEAGSGSVDFAEDCVTIATLLRAARKKTKDYQLLSKAEIEQLETGGNWLLDNLQPAGARRPRKSASDAALHRDALAALLRTRYQTLRAVAYWFHGDNFDQFVPPLLSTTVVKSEDVPANPDSPEPAK